MCHESVISFVQGRIAPDEITGRRVLEVGSYDVNGSPRSVLLPYQPSEYVGVDVSAGPGVDEVCDALNVVERFGAESFDVVVSTEMLEHARDWRGAVSNMKRVLRPGGLLVLTTRSPGFQFHNPPDHWRFTVDDAWRIFADLGSLTVLADPQVPGIFVRGVKPAGFVETELGTLDVFSMI